MIRLLILLLVCGGAFAKEIPLIPNEVTYLPVIGAQLDKYWPGHPPYSIFAAQVRQETCPSLKSRMCYSPHAELKTDREYGFGLGQITITKSFDNFKAARQLDSSLSGWQWENRYNAEFQLRTLVLMDKSNYVKFAWASDDRMAFALAAYNGGVGGVLSDRAVCRATLGCDPNQWFGHVEHTSKKAKLPVKGYGQSFFQINRGYVRQGMITFRPRYMPYFKEM